MRLVFIVFLAFSQGARIYALKSLAWMSRDFLTNSTTEISILQNFYLLNFYPSSFNLNLLRLTPLNCSFTHKVLVFLLSTPAGLGSFLLMTFLSDSNDLLIFLFSFPTKLGGFLLINLSGFLLQFSYWVRRFFTKIEWLCFYQQLIINRLIFFLSFFTELRDFLSITLLTTFLLTLSTIFWFFFLVSYWVRKFFIDWSGWFFFSVFSLD